MVMPPAAQDQPSDPWAQSRKSRRSGGARAAGRASATPAPDWTGSSNPIIPAYYGSAPNLADPMLVAPGGAVDPPAGYREPAMAMPQRGVFDPTAPWGGAPPSPSAKLLMQAVQISSRSTMRPLPVDGPASDGTAVARVMLVAALVCAVTAAVAGGLAGVAAGMGGVAASVAAGRTLWVPSIVTGVIAAASIALAAGVS